MVRRGDHSHNDRSYMIQIMERGQVVTRHSKHIEVTPTTAEQYLMDQLGKSTADPVDIILQHFEKQAQENLTINLDKQRWEDTSLNSNSDTQQSNMQEHIVNWIPANSAHEDNLRCISFHRKRDKPGENTNTHMIWKNC